LGPEARAIVLYSNATGNTTAPASAEGLDGWNLQATFGNFFVTPIAGQYFIAAQHIYAAPSSSGYSGPTSVTLNSVAYPLDLSFNGGLGCANDPGSDLRIYKIQGTFPAWAPLYTSADGPELGKTATMMGMGAVRGTDVVDTAAGYNLVRGWQWGANRAASWGQNVVSGYDDYSAGSPDSLLRFNFDSKGIDNEGALSVGDSSGGVFILSGGQWKLAGVNYAMDSPWSTTGTGTRSNGFNADIFDSRGLYQWDGSSWVYNDPRLLAPIPTAGYASRISDRADWIASVVPEPGTLGLLVVLAPVMLLLACIHVKGRHHPR
jgi:hypothetical protein